MAIALSRRLDRFVEWAHQLLDLANLYHQHSSYEQALALLDQFLQFPTSERSPAEKNLHTLLKRQVYFQKGVIHKDNDRLQLAERNFRESLTLAPDRWETYLELGRTLMSMARYREAAQVLQDGKRLSPVESGPILEALGDAYHHLGRDARVHYEDAVSYYKRQGREDDVLRVSGRLMTLFADHYLKDLLNQ